jgi:hypothetical protein
MRIFATLIGIISLLVLLTHFSSCRKDLGSSDGALKFSVDTVIFDTVFTTIGSTTKRFMIYNDDNSPVTISSVHLAGGIDSKYRINIDGVSGVVFSNIEIPGKDSLFAFVEVTLDPNNIVDPAMVIDSVIFNTNGITQDVDLVACGWDAHFISPTFNLGGLGPASVLGCDTTWGPGKPIVVYGWAAVDSLCCLTMLPGTHVYIHKNSGIFVYKEACLKILGSQDQPVEIASDRLDEFYEDQAGEWDRIWLFAESRENVIQHALIKNGSVGVQVDSFNLGSSEPTLKMENVVIENMAAASLFAQGSRVVANNCVFGNAAQYSAALTIGGNYEFRHCTFGNNWGVSSRETPTVQVNNWYEDVFGVINVRDLENAYFGNCIIYGNRSNELIMDGNAGGQFNFQFDNCLIRVDQAETDVSNASNYVNCIINDDPMFIEPSENNFELDTLSPARNSGSMTIVNSNIGVLGTDIIGNSRTNDSGPDLGAYERQE